MRKERRQAILKESQLKRLKVWEEKEDERRKRYADTYNPSNLRLLRKRISAIQRELQESQLLVTAERQNIAFLARVHGVEGDERVSAIVGAQIRPPSFLTAPSMFYPEPSRPTKAERLQGAAFMKKLR